MTEDERRLQISLRLKAARLLAGRRAISGRKKGSIPLPIEELIATDALRNERITHNRVEAIEQMKGAPVRGSELDAFVVALGLPDDWFDGLYPSNRGSVASSLGRLLQAVGEDVRARRPGLAEVPPEGDEGNPRSAARADAS